VAVTIVRTTVTDGPATEVVTGSIGTVTVAEPATKVTFAEGTA